MSRTRLQERLDLLYLIGGGPGANRVGYCSAFAAGDPERFRRLLTEQVTVGELLDPPE